MTMETIEFELLDFKVLPKHDGHGARIMRKPDGRHWIQFYVPKAKADNVAAIQTLARPYAPPEPWTGPIRLDLYFRLRMLKSWSKREREEHVGMRHWERHPDLDNLRKQVQDALQGLFYVDDRQICEGHTRKTWGWESAVQVTLMRPQEVD